jgi:hypothetical protein
VKLDGSVPLVHPRGDDTLDFDAEFAKFRKAAPRAPVGIRAVVERAQAKYPELPWPAPARYLMRSLGHPAAG